MGTCCSSQSKNNQMQVSDVPEQFTNFQYYELPIGASEIKYGVLGEYKDSDLFKRFNSEHTLWKDRKVKVTCNNQLENSGELDTLLSKSQELAMYSAFLIFVPSEQPAASIDEYVQNFIGRIQGKGPNIPVVIILQGAEEQRQILREKLKEKTAQGQRNQVYLTSDIYQEHTGCYMLFSVAMTYRPPKGSSISTNTNATNDKEPITVKPIETQEEDKVEPITVKPIETQEEDKVEPQAPIDENEEALRKKARIIGVDIEVLRQSMNVAVQNEVMDGKAVLTETKPIEKPETELEKKQRKRREMMEGTGKRSKKHQSSRSDESDDDDDDE